MNDWPCECGHMPSDHNSESGDCAFCRCFDYRMNTEDHPMTDPTPLTPDACQHPDCGHPRDDNECHVDAGSPFFHPFVPPTPASLTTDEIARTGPISILIDRGKVTP